MMQNKVYRILNPNGSVIKVGVAIPKDLESELSEAFEFNKNAFGSATKIQAVSKLTQAKSKIEAYVRSQNQDLFQTYMGFVAKQLAYEGRRSTKMFTEKNNVEFLVASEKQIVDPSLPRNEYSISIVQPEDMHRPGPEIHFVLPYFSTEQQENAKHYIEEIVFLSSIMSPQSIELHNARRLYRL